MEGVYGAVWCLYWVRWRTLPQRVLRKTGPTGEGAWSSPGAVVCEGARRAGEVDWLAEGEEVVKGVGADEEMGDGTGSGTMVAEEMGWELWRGYGAED